MKFIFNLVTVLAGLSVVVSSAQIPEERALEMLHKMTLKEKLTMMHGVHGTYVGNIPGNERLGIPSLNMHDGPQGFRATGTTGGDGTSTAWPSSLSIAASWDKDLLYSWAVAMGQEFKQKGANIALLPGIGIARVPTAGRNFEYLCGEDPFLGSHLVKPVISGVQEQGIMANAKHFINNEIETARMRVSANVNERVRFELYYPPFQAAVDVGVLSVMCAYNRINDVYACQNNNTFSHLRDTMGFKGFMFSDWTATKSTAESVHAGLDQELPFGLFYSDIALERALKNNEISITEIDASVARVLTAMYRIGLFDNPNTGNPEANVTSEAHNTLARKIAATSTVLLKNTGDILPLNKEKIASSASHCIAVIGDESTVAGGGSGHVNPAYVITNTQGIKNAVDGTTIEVKYTDGLDVTTATQYAASCEVAIVNVATTSSEASDRPSLSLGNGQDELVTAVLAANKNTIVSVVTPGAILLPWADAVPAVLISWLPGQEAGNALADVLFGVVNPSAKLPVTLPNKENEVGFTPEQFPGVGDKMPEASYTEELLIGYRWYQANNVVPLYPFGHGLSYTSFLYSSLRVKTLPFETLQQTHKHVDFDHAVVNVVLTIRNTGKRAGTDVVQLYLSYPTAANEPPRQLRGIFKPAELAAGEFAQVSFELRLRDVSVWDAEAHTWSVMKGTYGVFVGSSSADIRLTGEFVL